MNGVLHPYLTSKCVKLSLIRLYTRVEISGHPICDNKALLEELLPPDQQILGRAAVASACLGGGLVGRC